VDDTPAGAGQTSLEAALEARHPDRFQKHTVMMAVAGVIARDGKILLTRDMHGFWSSPGGWIDDGESPEQAIVREVREELGVVADVTCGHRPHVAWHVPRSSDNATFILFVLGVRLRSEDFRLQPEEVTDVRWFGPEEWGEAPMLPYVRALFDERIGEWMGG
jgi:8-oxo-dGTP diphosphatase